MQWEHFIHPLNIQIPKLSYQHLPRTTFLDARFKNNAYLDVGVIETVRVFSSDRSEES